MEDAVSSPDFTIGEDFMDAAGHHSSSFPPGASIDDIIDCDRPIEYRSGALWWKSTVIKCGAHAIAQHWRQEYLNHLRDY